jgi:hypothetical protein
MTTIIRVTSDICPKDNKLGVHPDIFRHCYLCVYAERMRKDIVVCLFNKAREVAEAL